MSFNIYKGEISSIDEDLLSFDLKGISMKFYAAKWVLVNKTFFTPNNFITIKLCHDYEDKYPILCAECQLEFSIKLQEYNNDLVDLMIKYNLDENYMKEVYKQHRNLLDEYFKTINIEHGKIIIEVLKEILIINKNRFNLKPISACQIVDGSIKRYKAFPFWTYTFYEESFSNENFAINSYIVGIIKVHDLFGVPMLLDAKWTVPLFIFNNNEIIKYINHFVLIKKALFIAEIFNVSKQQTMSCVILDTNDVIPLNSISLNDTNNIVNVLEMDSKRFVVNLNHIGPVLKGQQDQEECWIEAHNDKLEKIFIVLTNELLKVRPLLSINYEYVILHKNPLNSYKWREIDRLYKLNGFKLQKSTTKFFVTSLSQPTKKLLNVQEAVYYLQEKTDDVNITGLIIRKTFRNLLKSFFGGKRYHLPFGTPGDSTHVIVLQGNNDNNLKIFLNDFNRYFFPFGLIPGMVVNILRVRPQSKNYFKCTPLTTFEYVKFNTPSTMPANLHNFYKHFPKVEGINCLNNLNTKLLPFDIVFLFQLKSLSVKTGLIIYDEEKEEVHVNILLNCKELSGFYQLQVKSESVLKSLLSANNETYEIFCNAVKEIKYFEYCPAVATEYNKPPRDESNIFKYSLNLALYTWSLKNFEIEVYVRRTWDNATNSIPLYTTVDF